MSGLIAYVGPFGFPDGGAAARRILGNARSLRDAGFEVVIGSGQMPDPAGGEVTDYEGFAVHSLGERTAEHMGSALKRLLYAAMGAKTVEWLDRLPQKPAAVILYSGYSPYLMRLTPWCAANGVPLIFDAVEWYAPPRWHHWLRSPYYWNTEAAMRHFIGRTGNVLAISRYLENYYGRRGCNTVLTPPTLDTRQAEARLEAPSTGPLVLVYTGTPAHKDLFDAYLQALLDLDPAGETVRLKVAGLTGEEVLGFPAMRRNGLRVLPGCVEAIGRVPHEAAMALTRSADFSILLRPQNRTSTAGFPTKVVESLAVGTPVICNHTSDLGQHIHDGAEGLICPDDSAASLRAAIERALALPGVARGRMRAGARARAEMAFDYRNYTDALAAFVGRAKPPRKGLV